MLVQKVATLLSRNKPGKFYNINISRCGNGIVLIDMRHRQGMHMVVKSWGGLPCLMNESPKLSAVNSHRLQIHKPVLCCLNRAAWAPGNARGTLASLMIYILHY